LKWKGKKEKRIREEVGERREWKRGKGKGGINVSWPPPMSLIAGVARSVGKI